MLQAYVWEDGDKIWIDKGKIKGHDFVAVPMCLWFYFYS